MNSCGYFLQFSSDNPDRPAFMHKHGNGLHRRIGFAAIEIPLPAQGIRPPVAIYVCLQLHNQLHPVDAGSGGGYELVVLPAAAEKIHTALTALSVTPAYTLAQNVIALVIEPMRSPELSAPGQQQWEAPVPTSWPPNITTTRGNGLTTTSGVPSPQATSAQAILSRNQLPPQVMVTMVAIDEASAARLQALYGGSAGSTMPSFSDTVSMPARLCQTVFIIPRVP